MAKPFIVVVEDDDVLAQFLLQKLVQQQMDVSHYTNGLDAVSGITTLGTKTDLILLDISLPDIDGFDVLKRLSAFQKKAHIPVIIISNFSLEKDIEWGQEMGVKKFLNKASVTPMEVVDLITDILAQEKTSTSI